MMIRKPHRLICILLVTSFFIIFSGSAKEELEQKKGDKLRENVPGNPSTKVHVLISGSQYLFPFKLFEDRIREESGIELL